MFDIISQLVRRVFVNPQADNPRYNLKRITGDLDGTIESFWINSLNTTKAFIKQPEHTKCKMYFMGIGEILNTTHKMNDGRQRITSYIQIGFSCDPQASDVYQVH